MKKKQYVIIFTVIAVLLLGIISAFAGNQSSVYIIGQKFGANKFDTSDEVVASYKSIPITESMVDYQLFVDQQRDEELRENMSREEVIDRLLIGRIVDDEAVQAGITVGQEEIDNMMTYLKSSYDQYPEARQSVDDFCLGAGLSIEEYWKQVEEQAYGIILRAKYKEYFYQTYIPPNSINGTNPVSKEAAEDAYEQYRQQLLEEHQRDIIYYP